MGHFDNTSKFFSIQTSDENGHTFCGHGKLRNCSFQKFPGMGRIFHHLRGPIFLGILRAFALFVNLRALKAFWPTGMPVPITNSDTDADSYLIIATTTSRGMSQ